MIIAFGGFSGSGKSYTARKLSKHLSCPYFNSDKIRKELAKISFTQKVFENFGQGIYSENFSKKTYKELFKRALTALNYNQNVIIDATFLSETSQRLLLDIDKNYIFIFCYANETVIKKRLEKRVRNACSVSDGRWEIYLKQKENFKGLIIPEKKIIKIDTSQKNYFENLICKLSKIKI